MLSLVLAVSVSVLAASTAVISAKYWSNLGHVLRRIPPKALLKRSKVYNELVYNDIEGTAIYLHKEVHTPYPQYVMRIICKRYI